MDRYYGSSIFKKMDDEGINNKVIMKETSDIITRKFSKKNLKLPQFSQNQLPGHSRRPSKKDLAPRKTVTIEKDIISLLANEQTLLNEGKKTKHELYSEIKQKLTKINLSDLGVKAKLFDNFESVQKYSEILMRNDDSFTAKKRL